MHIEPELKLAIALHSSPGVYALLLGSGLSSAAGIPTGWQITLDLIVQSSLPKHLPALACRRSSARWQELSLRKPFRSVMSARNLPGSRERGNREMRKHLSEATLSAARYNPSIRSIYRRLKEVGKPEKVARIAAARKLLLIAHAVYTTGVLYRDPTEKEG